MELRPCHKEKLKQLGANEELIKIIQKLCDSYKKMAHDHHILLNDKSFLSSKITIKKLVE